MLEILRNMARRRSRTFLTVMGIFTGVLALTVMGALAERINRMVGGSEAFFTRQITIYPSRSMSMTGGFVLPEQMERIRALAGVSQVVPVVELFLGLDNGGFVMGPPPSLQGIDLSNPFVRSRLEDLPLRAGRTLREGDAGVAVAGSDVAEHHDWQVGDTITLRGGEFELVGVLDRLMTLPDQHVYVNLTDARALLVRESSIFESPEEPGTRAEGVSFPSFRLDQVATGLSVEWLPTVDPHELSSQIQDAVPELRVLSPERMRRMLGQAMTIFNLIVIGSAAIALVVGGLSVVNTMTMAVSERRSEIGLKKALGAPGRSLFAEYLAESAAMGLMGGLLGVGVGTLMVIGLNTWGAGQTQVFLVTPRLLLFATAFATLLGALSGLLPAIRVMRMHPVDALRDE